MHLMRIGVMVDDALRMFTQGTVPNGPSLSNRAGHERGALGASGCMEIYVVTICFKTVFEDLVSVGRAATLRHAARFTIKDHTVFPRNISRCSIFLPAGWYF